MVDLLEPLAARMINLHNKTNYFDILKRSSKSKIKGKDFKDFSQVVAMMDEDFHNISMSFPIATQPEKEREVDSPHYLQKNNISIDNVDYHNHKPPPAFLELECPHEEVSKLYFI